MKHALSSGIAETVRKPQITATLNYQATPRTATRAESRNSIGRLTTWVERAHRSAKQVEVLEERDRACVRVAARSPRWGFKTYLLAQRSSGRPGRSGIR